MSPGTCHNIFPITIDIEVNGPFTQSINVNVSISANASAVCTVNPF